MLQDLKKIFRRNYQPLNKIGISAANLKHNYQYLSSIDKNIKVAPVLKSNAYGHGLTIVAKVLDALAPPFFCVDSLYEAYELLRTGIRTPILIMGYVSPKSLITKILPFSFAVFDFAVLGTLNKYQPGAKIHIFVDTGMHREGLNLADLPKFVSYIKEKTNLQIEGLMSHLAESENPQHKLTQQQITNFQKAIRILDELNIKPKFVHLGNSSALLQHQSYRGKLGNMARAGIALYGIDPDGKNIHLKPALTLKSQLGEIKNIGKGEYLGYDFTYRTKDKIKIAILPVGYFDGVNRKLSNRGFVKANGKYCPIVGRVSMNITIINISNLLRPRIGQEVTVYSNNPNDKNSIQAAAKTCGLIPYELLVYLASSTKRILV